MLKRTPRKSPFKSDPLPEHLKLTPERRLKVEAHQARLRELALQRGRLTPEAKRMQLGTSHETSARTDVEMLTAELRSNKDPDKQARLVSAQGRLAEALAHQGRYDEAAAAAPTRELQQQYAAMWNAVWRDDAEDCACEPFVDGKLELTHDHVAEEVLSLKHSRIMPAVRCNQCGHTNVRTLPHHLQQLQRARLEGERLLQGLKGAQAKSQAAGILTNLRDSKVLTQ